ncbi:RIP metalloprotease RseP [bacterium]|nr:RIP metalloprotease RseP [bacterium]
MNVIIMILLVSALILVHELGHFFAARICKVTVPRFGFGLPVGPSVKLFRWHQTDFYLHAFLFGGYVLFPDDLGEEKEENDNKEENKEKLEIKPEELYSNKRISQKLFIVSAGVLMNLLFAVFIVFCCAIFYGKLPTSTQEIVVKDFAPKITSNIIEAGIQKGDKFHKVNNKEITTYYQLIINVVNSRLFDGYADNDLIEENLKDLKTLNPTIKNDVVLKGETLVLPSPKPEKQLDLNKNVMLGLERYKKTGQKLTPEQIDLRNSIYNTKKFEAFEDMNLKDIAIALSDTYKPLSITVLRNGKEINLENIQIGMTGLMGLQLARIDKYAATRTPGAVVVKSLQYVWDTTVLTVVGLRQMITGKIDATDMHGVIAIVKVGGDIIATKGMLNGLLLTAMISINLAILNILPIPALDGGHVLFLLIEKFTGKKPSEKLSEKLNNFFFTLLLILLVLVCYNDIYALVTKQF